MRTPLDLVGTSIDVALGQWNNRLGGTGAGADSFYEYLLKAYVLFGKSDSAFRAVAISRCCIFQSPVCYVLLVACVGCMQPFCHWLCVPARLGLFYASAPYSTSHISCWPLLLGVHPELAEE